MLIPHHLMVDEELNIGLQELKTNIRRSKREAIFGIQHIVGQ